MTAFDGHGIDHLSASSLNLWMANPREWAVRYLAKEADEEAVPALWRGTAVEAGLAQLLHGHSIEDARSAAADAFELNAVGELSEQVEFERGLVLSMLNRAATWPPPGELTASQLRIEHWFEHVPVPLLGYLDFAFATGVDIDLKTTRACPSQPRGNHVRQVALYRAARGRRGGLLYVTDRKLAYFEIEDAEAGAALDDLRDAALSLSQFLVKVQDADEALACLPYNPDDFRTRPRAKLCADVL
jgi:hypothetical protein